MRRKRLRLLLCLNVNLERVEAMVLDAGGEEVIVLGGVLSASFVTRTIDPEVEDLRKPRPVFAGGDEAFAVERLEGDEAENMEEEEEEDDKDCDGEKGDEEEEEEDDDDEEEETWASRRR